MLSEAIHHPKMKLLAHELKVEHPHAVGIFEILIHWAGQYCLDGNITKYCPVAVSEAVMWSGSPQDLIDALVASRLLDKVNNEYHIHDWRDNAPSYIKRKMTIAKRRAPRQKSQTNRPGQPEMSGGEVSRVEMSGGGGESQPPTADWRSALEGLETFEKDLRLVKNMSRLWGSWAKAYPGVDLAHELAKAHAWLVGNNKRVNAIDFLNRWLSNTRNDSSFARVGEQAKPSVEEARPIRVEKQWDLTDDEIDELNRTTFGDDNAEKLKSGGSLGNISGEDFHKLLYGNSPLPPGVKVTKLQPLQQAPVPPPKPDGVREIPFAGDNYEGSAL